MKRVKADYEIVVVDADQQPFPPARDLTKVGVPMRVARRWKVVRRAMTSGLRQRVKADRN